MGARTVPTGWRCSDRIKRKAERLLPRLEDILYRKVEKYARVPGIDAEALMQEARLLATYAIDTWDKGRGKKLRGWVDLVVRNGLLAEVNFEKALKRAPREAAPKRRSRRRDRRLAEFTDTEALLEMPGIELPNVRERFESLGLVERILLGLDQQDRRVLEIKLNPPPELVVCARNQRPNHPRITDKLIAEYLKLPVSRIKRAVQTARAIWRELDGGV